jgi:hypothetical protein
MWSQVDGWQCTGITDLTVCEGTEVMGKGNAGVFAIPCRRFFVTRE